MNIYYWSPYLSKVATAKAVINSAESIKYFTNNRIDTLLINAAGEWDSEKKILEKKKISIINIFKKNYYDELPRYGFIVIVKEK
jgi:hypothetical protein